MKKLFFVLYLILLCITGNARISSEMMEKDFPAYLFAYALDENEGRSGLHFAWSRDSVNWYGIGPEHGFVKSDYGRWGSQKRMIAPCLFQSPDGTWHCVWSLNDEDNAFAHASSKDLVYWGRQSYPITGAGGNCKALRVSYNAESGEFTVSWINDKGAVQKGFTCTTTDFKRYSEAKETVIPDISHKEVILSGKPRKGTLHPVSWALIEGLIQKQKLEAYKSIIHSEKTIDDPVRFKGLKPLEARITIDAGKGKRISDLLMGVFFEDINYAADGGLYAELVQNRDFEYALSDKEGRDPEWNSRKAWSVNGGGIEFSIDTALPIHPNNRHYAVLDVSETTSGLTNEGFDGIAVKAGEKYDFSFFVRSLGGKSGKFNIRLTGKDGEVYGEAMTKAATPDWKKLQTVITARKSAPDARLEVRSLSEGSFALDMISLFPQNTFKGRKNGLRADLAQAIADIKPRFVRFPGGCVAHGDGIHNIYRWKNTIGPLEARTPMRNLWGYHQTLGLGYYEYFRFCKDIGAEPLPVLAAGVPCQNSGDGGAGQQCGIPLHEMKHYIQDILDLVEWANGDAKTTKWGKARAEAGHPEPFNLKYIGIGNEDLITDIFEERFTMIYNALRERHPEITVIGTVGPFCEGTDYTEGWELATKLGVEMVDEHYYNPPGWFIHNQDFYDKYDRSKAKVYLGEYASHLPGRPNNLETALSEALYMTSIERNGDIVSMTSYAPLLAKERRTQWNPDLIYFNNTEVKPTVGYYVQQLYGQNAGETYYPQQISLSEKGESVRKRFAVSVVGTSGNEMIVKMVNLLPVSVKPQIEWDGIAIEKSVAAEVSLMTGKPDDMDVRPVRSKSTAGEALSAELPPYSFKVIRMIF